MWLYTDSMYHQNKLFMPGIRKFHHFLKAEKRVDLI